MNDLAGAFPELSARTGYAINPIERLSERREDAGFVAECAADASALAILIAGDAAILRREGEAITALFPLRSIEARETTLERAFLGLDGKRPVFATLIGPSAPRRSSKRGFSPSTCARSRCKASSRRPSSASSPRPRR